MENFKWKERKKEGGRKEERKHSL